MKKMIVLVAFLCGFIVATAQDTYNSSGTKSYYYKKQHSHKHGYDPSKLVIGGGLSASYSTDYAQFGISPLVGYQFGKDFTAGVGLGYLYSMQPQWDVSSYNQVYHTYENIIYPSLWARYRVYRNWFVSSSLEYDLITLKQYDVYYDPTNGAQYLQQDKYKVSATCLLMGVGFRQPIAGRVSLLIEVMYDVLQQEYSPYFGQPVFRGGIVAGL